MLHHRGRAVLAAGLVLLCGCSPASTGMSAGGDEPPAPVAWTFESVSWFNRYSMNSTVGPLVVGQTVLYGGTYGYQNTMASKLAALDGTTGMARWHMEYAAVFGPMVLQGGTIAVGAGESVLGLDFASGAQRGLREGMLKQRVRQGGGCLDLVINTYTGSVQSQVPVACTAPF